MRKSFGIQTWMYPMPVLMVGTYNPDGTPNAMNAAWGGIYDTNQIMLCLSHDHRTTDNIKARGVFTVSFAAAGTEAQADYVGMVSGNDVPDKCARAGLHPQAAEAVDAPVFAEWPVSAECRLVKFNEDGICIGEIVNISADERVLAADGLIDTDALAPLCFDSVRSEYRVIGRKTADAFVTGEDTFPGEKA